MIRLTGGFRTLDRGESATGRPAIQAEAGVSLRHLVRWSVEEGIGGFEPLAGIPGTVGGALTMNAGAWGFEIGERILELEALSPEGEVHRYRGEDLSFGYRTLRLPPGSIVLGAMLEGENRSPEQVKARVAELHRRRRGTQPIREPSAGSVFKNPPGRSAGQLIESCGLKGVRVGDAEISRTHANFIVNLGKASAGQVVTLMGMIQERVREEYGLELEPEVKIVGDVAEEELRVSG